MDELEKHLHIAKARLAMAMSALAPKPKGGEWEECHAANEEVLRIERALAASRGEEYAETIPFPVKWDVGAPMPSFL